MSKKRDKIRKRKRHIWEDVKRELLRRARQRIGLGPDEIIPDAALLAEVDHYLPVHTGFGEPNYYSEPRHQWFGFRLIGLADSESERDALARRLRTIHSGRSRWGLGPGSAPRRSPAAARRRNRRRRPQSE
jgi:hypothetical protein